MRKKILIIDNDSELQFLISQMLTDADYETCSLFNGKLVMETIAQFAPDLILLDVMMGNLDGRNLCKYIKENPESEAIPVILVSAVYDLPMSLGQQGGPNDIISKPFDIDDFLTKVAHYLKE